MFLRVAINVLQMLLVLAALIFALLQQGEVQLNWHGQTYNFNLTTALLALLLFVLTVLLLHRLLLAIATIPKHWHRQQHDKRLERSLTSLVNGFTAITLGDSKIAENAAAKAHKQASHPQSKALTLILHAQIAKFHGDTAAMQAYLAQLQTDAPAIITPVHTTPLPTEII